MKIYERWFKCLKIPDSEKKKKNMYPIIESFGITVQ